MSQCSVSKKWDPYTRSNVSYFVTVFKSFEFSMFSEYFIKFHRWVSVCIICLFLFKWSLWLGILWKLRIYFTSSESLVHDLPECDLSNSRVVSALAIAPCPAISVCNKSMLVNCSDCDNGISCNAVQISLHLRFPGFVPDMGRHTSYNARLCEDRGCVRQGVEKWVHQGSLWPTYHWAGK